MNNSVNGTVTECCSQCELISHSSREPTRFSFIYVQMVWGFILMVLIAQFLFVMFRKRKEILKYHDTISSFCAYKHGWESRFLLIFTLVISANMLSILFEEYNGRYWEIEAAAEWELFLLFLSECICIGLFPFVGIFYTKGNHPDPAKHNKDYECPYGNCRIETSEMLHKCGAYMFILGLCCTSIVWAIFFLVQFVHTKYYALAVFSFIWSILQLLGGIIFVILQIVLAHSFRIKIAWLSGNEYRQKSLSHDAQLHLDLNRVDATAIETDNDSPRSDSSGSDVIGADQEQYRLIATKVRYASFIMELLVGTSVIALFIMNTITRMSFENVVHQHDMITNFAKEETDDMNLENPDKETNAWMISMGIVAIIVVLCIIECVLYTKRQLKEMETSEEKVANNKEQQFETDSTTTNEL